MSDEARHLPRLANHVPEFSGNAFAEPASQSRDRIQWLVDGTIGLFLSARLLGDFPF